jgi:translocation and assembly module TamB
MDFNGKFNDIPISIDGTMGIGNKVRNIVDINMNIENTKLSAKGHLAPLTDVHCEIDNLNINELLTRLPAINLSLISGVYSGSFRITNEDYKKIEDFVISGRLLSSEGKFWKFPFERFSTNVYYSNGYLQFRDMSSDLFNGKLSAAADVKIKSGDVPSVAARLEMRDIDTSSMSENFPWVEKISGFVEIASCDLAGPINSLSAKAEAVVPAMRVAGFSCTGIKANIDMKKSSNVKINFLGNVQDSPAQGIANIAISKDIDVSMDIALPKITIGSFNTNFSQIDQWGLKGFGSAALSIRGPISNLVYDVKLASPALNLLGDQHLSDVTTEIIYKGSVLSVKNARAKWRDALVTASGNVRLGIENTPPKFTLSGGVTDLNISNLGEMNPIINEYKLGGVVSGNWAVDGDSKNPVASVDLKTPRLFAKVAENKFTLTEAHARAKFDGGRVNLSEARFKFFGSNILAAGDISPAGKDRPLEYNIKGSFADIDPSFLASMGIISGDVSGKLTGDARVWKSGNDAPSFRVFFKNSSFRYFDKFDVKGINGTATYSKGNLSFDNFRSDLNMGNINLSGVVGNVMNWQNPSLAPLDMSASVKSADISHIARIFAPMSKGFQGLMSGEAVIKGNLGAPTFKADASIMGVRALGLFLPVLQFNGIEGGTSGINFPDITARLGRGRIKANGSIEIGKNWEIYVKAEGSSVDIRSLTVPLDNEMRREITGALDFNFEGGGSLESFKGKGKADIPSLNALGMKMTDASAKFSIYDGFAVMEDSSAKAYGGHLEAQLVKDLNLSDWGGQISLTSADMAPLYKDFAPESEGSITGATNFTMRFTGDSRRTNMKDGNGELEVQNGEIIGFEATQAISRLMGGNPLRFQSAHFSFTVDGKTIYIIPGSRISAHQEDPVFKYVMFDGSFTTDKNIDISCVGNVNIRALNALTAGIQGVLASTFENGGIGDTKDLLQDFLGNTLTGFSKNEFRDISLKIKGSPGDIRFSDVKIASPVKMDAMPEALKNSDGYKDDDQERIQIKVEIPVGPGADNSSESLKGQVGGQLLEQVLKGLIFE